MSITAILQVNGLRLLTYTNRGSILMSMQGVQIGTLNAFIMVILLKQNQNYKHKKKLKIIGVSAPPFSSFFNHQDYDRKHTK